MDHPARPGNRHPGARDIEESKALLEWIKEQINDIYARRDQIHPPLHQPGSPESNQHSQLLPMTNCEKIAAMPPVWPMPPLSGKVRSASKTAGLSGKKNTEKKGKNSRPTWKVLAGGPLDE